MVRVDLMLTMLLRRRSRGPAVVGDAPANPVGSGSAAIGTAAEAECTIQRLFSEERTINCDRTASPLGPAGMAGLKILRGRRSFE